MKDSQTTSASGGFLWIINHSIYSIKIIDWAGAGY